MVSTEVKQLINSSYRRALRQRDPRGVGLGQVHARRSQDFVEALAHNFRTHFRKGNNSGVRVFSRHSSRDRDVLGTNEFLFDVHVCRMGILKRPSGKELFYVAEPLIQVESEFNTNKSSRADTGLKAQMIDFSKLVVGAAAQKIFIGGFLSGDPQWIADALSPLADKAARTGQVFAFFLPHPSLWSKGKHRTAKVDHAFQWRSGRWKSF